jgi:hypothetical protein
MRTGAAAVLLVASLLASRADAAGHLALAPVTGDARGALGAQLREALCEARPCGDAVVVAGRVKLAATRRAGAGAVLVGAVRPRGQGRGVELLLYTVSARPARRWLLPLGRAGTLRAAHAAALAADVAEVLPAEPEARPAPPPSRRSVMASVQELEAPAARPPPATVAAPTPIPPPVAPPPAATPDRDVAQAPATTVTPATSPPAPVPSQAAPATSPPPPRPAVAILSPPRSEVPAPPSSAPRRAPPTPRSATRPARSGIITLDAGLESTRTRLSFPAGTAPVGYRVTLPGSGYLRVALRPLVLSEGVLSRLGLFGELGYQPAFDMPVAPRVHDATTSRLRAGASWHLRAGSLALAPSLAYARDTFEVAPVAGVRAPGVPDSRLQGVSLGLAAELPLPVRLTALAAASGTYWLQAGELAGGTRFFPGGAAFGADGEAGLALRFLGPVSVRASGFGALTHWSLDADPSGAYTVRSARTTTWGGRFTLRAGF